MGSNETRPGAYRHPQGDAGVETGNITRHQLILRLFGVSLRTRTRVAGQSSRECICGIESGLIGNILRMGDGHHDACRRQHQHSAQHEDAHNSDDHHP